MAARANWKGFLKVAELTCPVALYTAVSSSERISFHILNRKTGHRVHRRFVDSDTGKPVDADELVRGYETGEGGLVTLGPDELAAAVPPSDKTLAVEAFLPCREIDDVYFDRPYYLDAQARRAEAQIVRGGAAAQGRVASAPLTDPALHAVNPRTRCAARPPRPGEESMSVRVLRPLAVAAVAFAVFAAAAHPAFALDKIRVGKAVPYIFSFAVVEVAQAEGFFKKEGLEVESIGFQGGAKLHQGMISGAVDMGLSSGADLAVVSRGHYAMAVGAMAGPPLLMGVIVPYNSPIKTLADLKGKRIGIGTVGSLTHWLTLSLAEHEGWGPEGVKVVAVGGSVPALMAALKLHQVDALMEAAAIGLNLEAKKQARLLTPVTWVKDFHIHMFYATDAFLKKDPSAVTRFMKAWFETIKWMRAHKPETVTIVRKVTHFSEAVENREYDMVMPMFSETGKFNPKALDVLANSFVQLHLLKTKPDLSQWVTEKYLPKM